MLDPFLRPVKDRALARLAEPLARVASPTALTLTGFALGIACAVSLYLGEHAGGLVLWAGNRLLDGLDGIVARTAGRQTDLGGYLDILLDFVVYAAVPIAVVHGRGGAPDAGLTLALALLLATFYVNAASWMYLSALLARVRNGGRTHEATLATSVEMPTGIVEGTETIAFFTAFMAFPGSLQPLFLAMAALTAATIGQRLAWAARNLPIERSRL